MKVDINGKLDIVFQQISCFQYSKFCELYKFQLGNKKQKFLIFVVGSSQKLETQIRKFLTFVVGTIQKLATKIRNFLVFVFGTNCTCTKKLDVFSHNWDS